MLRFLTAGLIFFISGCATVPHTGGIVPPASTMEGLCAKYALDCSWDGVAQTVTLHYRGQKIQAMVGSRIVMVDKEKLTLSAALKRVQGAVVVPPDLERAVFSGGKPAAVPLRAGRLLGKIVVDAGHGGKDPGAIGLGGVREKDIDLDIAMRVTRNFRAAGVDVIQTRSNDSFISLAERTSIASRPGVDLFLSIHANATNSRRACGIEVYYSGPLTLQDKLETQRLQNERRLCSALNMRRDSADVRGIVVDMLYANKLADGPELAEALTRELDKSLGKVSRGSKTARFFVLRNTLVPAVLVEVGFISNVKEAAQLKSGAYRQRVADAITKSVMRYLYASGI
jgi:N-acetylmuramoyl-L-alanine amidase